MAVIALSPGLNEIVDPNARVDKLASGFQFTEGPAWSARDRALAFSDIPGDTLYRWNEARGVQVLRKPSANANGNTFDGEGRLLSCEHSGRRVSRTKTDGSVETMVDSYEGKRLNSPNDLVCASNGDIYFTDPPYGLRRPDGSFAPADLPFNGVFRCSVSTGALTLLADDFARPNGLALSEDQRRLFIADTQEAHVRVFDIASDGSLTDGRVFVDTRHEGATARPDGIKVDRRGNLYVASSLPTGVWIYDPAGRLLGMIGVGENPANLGFGDDGWTALFVTAQTSIYRVQLKVAGQPLGAA